MKKIEFYDVGNLISPKDIDDFETNFNISLPPNYKKLLLKFNGGVPSDRILISNDEEVSVGGFYSIKYGNILLEDAIKNFQISQQLIPSDCIPIGYDGFGNPYCISTNDEDYGKIYCWFFDMGEEEGRLMADSLEEFLGGEI
ncbi:MAG: SMI1/KNR4 family protein [Bacteroidota bacterium]